MHRFNKTEELLSNHEVKSYPPLGIVRSSSDDEKGYGEGGGNDAFARRGDGPGWPEVLVTAPSSFAPFPSYQVYGVP